MTQTTPSLTSLHQDYLINRIATDGTSDLSDQNLLVKKKMLLQQNT